MCCRSGLPYRTFKWSNDARGKAAVHCVIIGFSLGGLAQQKFIFDGVQNFNVDNINPYLVNAPDVLVESLSRPLCNVPEIGIGNKPIDSGNYLFNKEEMEAFIKREPLSEEYFRSWYGAEEFINKEPRYCLYLGNCTPGELRRMPYAMERVNAVRKLRLESKSEGTRKIADRPTQFHVTNIPTNHYLLIPSVSSENRRYIPIGFMKEIEMASNLVGLR